MCSGRRMLALAAALCATAEACVGEQCKTKTIDSGSCKVEVKECMCLFNLQQKYNAKATEKHSGKHSDTTSWHSSKDEAYEQAVKQLFNDKLVHDKDKPDQSDYCNCQHADQAVGQCTIRGTACAMFNSTDDVKKGKVSYQAWATDMATHKVGHVSKYADPTAAGTAAFMDLLQGYPSETSCLNASSPAPKLVMPAPAATCDARSLIAAHEGKRLCVYKDTMGARAAHVRSRRAACARARCKVLTACIHGAQAIRRLASATTWTTPGRLRRLLPWVPTTTPCAPASSASRTRKSCNSSSPRISPPSPAPSVPSPRSTRSAAACRRS